MIVYDIEANGLFEDSSEVHCLVAKNIDTGVITRLYDTTNMYITPKDNDLELTKENIEEVLPADETLICHNQLGYDTWMLHKFFDIDLIKRNTLSNLIDTYVWSQALYPDRPMPKSCPAIVLVPGKAAKRVGPHGLESWGYRVSKKKPMISDWSTFTNEMLIRCEEDVLINEGAYYLLKEEAGL